MFGFWGWECPNLGVVNVRILGVANVRLANNLTPIRATYLLPISQILPVFDFGNLVFGSWDLLAASGISIKYILPLCVYVTIPFLLHILMPSCHLWS